MHTHQKISLLTLLGLLSLGIMLVLAATTDTTTLTFTVTESDRTPVIDDWFDPDILIPHMAEAEFFCEVYDIDNSSDELKVYLVHSDDSFTEQNESILLTWTSTTGYNHTYNYTWSGQPEGTYFQYYYTVNDSQHFVKKPSEPGIYFDIQWDVAPSDGGGGISETSEATTETIFIGDLILQTTDHLCLIAILGVGTIMIGILLLTRKKRL